MNRNVSQGSIRGLKWLVQSYSVSGPVSELSGFNSQLAAGRNPEAPVTCSQWLWGYRQPNVPVTVYNVIHK